MKTEISMQWQTAVEMIPLQWNKHSIIIKKYSFVHSKNEAETFLTIL